MVQYFYVLFNTVTSSFYVDDPAGFNLYTKDLLLAEQYHTEDAARNSLKYFKESETWIVKKVTVSIDL